MGISGEGRESAHSIPPTAGEREKEEEEEESRHRQKSGEDVQRWASPARFCSAAAVFVSCCSRVTNILTVQKKREKILGNRISSEENKGTISNGNHSANSRDAWDFKKDTRQTPTTKS